MFWFDLMPNWWFESKLFDSRKSVKCLQMHFSKILEHTGSMVMGRLLSMLFFGPLLRYDPCCNGKVYDVCQGLCDYDSNVFEKTWRKVVRSRGLFTSGTVTSISLKASLVSFWSCIDRVDQMEFLNLIDFSFKALAIFEKNEQNELAMDFLLVVHLT